MQFDVDSLDEVDLLVVRADHGRRRRQLARRLLLAYGALGLVVVLVGAGMFLLEFDLTATQKTTLILGLIGVALVVIGFVGERLLSRPSLDPDDIAGETASALAAAEFLVAWGEFEAAAAESLSVHGAAFEARSLSSVIHALQESHLIEKEEQRLLRLLLRFRNAIAHGSTPPSPDTSAKALQCINSLTHRIHARQ